MLEGSQLGDRCKVVIQRLPRFEPREKTMLLGPTVRPLFGSISRGDSVRSGNRAISSRGPTGRLVDASSRWAEMQGIPSHALQKISASPREDQRPNWWPSATVIHSARGAGTPSLTGVITMLGKKLLPSSADTEKVSHRASGEKDGTKR